MVKAVIINRGEFLPREHLAMCLKTHLVVELGERRMLWAFMGHRQRKPLNILQCRALASNSLDPNGNTT